MCYWCWEETDQVVAPTPETDRLVELIGRLYEQPDCGSGGPLHCALDDWNVRDEEIMVSYNTYGIGKPYGPEVREICEEIVAIMNRMTVEQRMYALAKHEGHVKSDR